MIDLMAALGVAATVSSTAVAGLASSVDDFRAAGAARFVAARLQQARSRAVLRTSDTALRIVRDTAGYRIATYDDGNRNGVLSKDIQSGVDPVVGPAERLIDQFPGVDFGVLPGIPGPEGSTAPGIDPIRLGSSDSVTFTSLGTATAGSLYLKGRRTTQYVVRIYGETGRTRILKFNVRTGTWLPL
jgi:hypothetical protein